MSETVTGENQTRRVREVAALFLHLGCTAFGGPAAHIALMHREVVEKRGWLESQEFLDLNSAVNLVPGPNSTELALHIGHRRAGWPGFFAAGFGFIAPAVLCVLVLAVCYEKYGALPLAQNILHGVAPVTVAIIAQALAKFFPTAIKNRVTTVIAVVAFAAAWRWRVELPILLAAAAFGLMFPPRIGPQSTVEKGRTPEEPRSRNAPAFALFAPLAVGLNGTIFWTFLKIGSVLYGSGYVLIAFLRAEVVQKLRWISESQLLDAVAIGQFTPGPLFTTATFIGYQVGGVAGALAATAGIFLPAFVFVALLTGIMEKLRGRRVRGFLDAVNAASWALMAVVTIDLAQSAMHRNAFAPVIFLAALTLLFQTRLNAAWLIVAGALCGLALPR